jgi:multimeric flavodoxin WrbA
MNTNHQSAGNLRALIFNCTLKHSPEKSNTAGLIELVASELNDLGVDTEILRPVDYNIEPGTSSRMGPDDEWPELLDKIKNCDIFIIASPVWVGHLCSVAQQVIERLDAIFWEEKLSDKKTGRYFTYGKVAGAICTGNEDGAHEVTGHLVWALQEFGFTVPPNANSYWVGEAGPGPSYLEVGQKSELTYKSALYMANNLVNVAQLLKKYPLATNLRELAGRAKQAVGSKRRK